MIGRLLTVLGAVVFRTSPNGNDFFLSCSFVRWNKGRASWGRKSGDVRRSRVPSARAAQHSGLPMGGSLFGLCRIPPPLYGDPDSRCSYTKTFEAIEKIPAIVPNLAAVGHRELRRSRSKCPVTGGVGKPQPTLQHLEALTRPAGAARAGPISPAGRPPEAQNEAKAVRHITGTAAVLRPHWPRFQTISTRDDVTVGARGDVVTNGYPASPK